VYFWLTATRQPPIHGGITWDPADPSSGGRIPWGSEDRDIGGSRNMQPVLRRAIVSGVSEKVKRFPQEFPEVSTSGDACSPRSIHQEKVRPIRDSLLRAGEPAPAGIGSAARFGSWNRMASRPRKKIADVYTKFLTLPRPRMKMLLAWSQVSSRQSCQLTQLRRGVSIFGAGNPSLQPLSIVA
jgi:hypothetical protein